MGTGLTACAPKVDVTLGRTLSKTNAYRASSSSLVLVLMCGAHVGELGASWR